MIVRVYSRKDFKQITPSEKEYYICINSNYGPDSDKIIEDAENVLNVQFDDSLTLERKWAEDEQTYYTATPITFEQGFVLYDFIKKIPIESVVNVYCSKGISRSGAVAEFLKREYDAIVESNDVLYPNERVLEYLYNAKFKFIQPISYDFAYDELVEYYNIIERDFQDLKWTPDIGGVKDSEKHKLEGFYGWAIQSNIEDTDRPSAPYNVNKQSSDVYRSTKMMFGFAQKLLDRFPYARQMGIAVHPPGVAIGQHTDNDQYVKIHFPIHTSNNSYFSFGEHRYVLEPGRGYLLDTRYTHGTDNQGDCNRIHLLLKLGYDNIEDALK